MSGNPASTSGAACSGDETVHTPRPSYPPRTTLATTGQPTFSANVTRSSMVPTGAQSGTGRPSSDSRSRMARLSWA
jgi:hypothetical protein